MIDILNKKDCCGCSACVQKCPKQCISLKEDNEGFLYPQVNQQECISCGICKKVCPIINPNEKRTPLQIYAAINKNEEIRRQSSSGGIFTLLSEEILKEGGVVFGARFDENWEVKHDYTENVKGLVNFRGSKYVQSRIEDNYKKVETFLKQGRKVLFSGTPCQIAGLKRFLSKEYDNLLTVDFICHGVPSPKVWRLYLYETYRKIIKRGGKHTASSNLSNSEGKSQSEDICFRNKDLGWKRYSFFLKLKLTDIKGKRNTAELFEPYSENIFMKGFLSDLYLRPSCYQCTARSGKSGSDITIADFWNIQQVMPEFDDDKGVSLILVQTNLGYLIFNKIKCLKKESSMDVVTRFNPAYHRNPQIHPKQILFYTALNKEKTISKWINKSIRKSFLQKATNKIKNKINNIYEAIKH